MALFFIWHNCTKMDFSYFKNGVVMCWWYCKVYRVSQIDGHKNTLTSAQHTPKIIVWPVSLHLVNCKIPSDFTMCRISQCGINSYWAHLHMQLM